MSCEPQEGRAKILSMATTEQIELVEAWAWLRAGGGLPQWDEHYGHQERQTMEYLFVGYMRWKYTHIQPRWYARALWAACTYNGEPSEGLVNKTSREVHSKFTRKEWDKNPLSSTLVDEVIENMPPFVPPFDDARRLTKMVHQIQQDDWRLAAWFKFSGVSMHPTDLRDFRFDLNTRQITARVNDAMKEFKNV